MEALPAPETKADLPASVSGSGGTVLRTLVPEQRRFRLQYTDDCPYHFPERWFSREHGHGFLDHEETVSARCKCV